MLKISVVSLKLTSLVSSLCFGVFIFFLSFSKVSGCGTMSCGIILVNWFSCALASCFPGFSFFFCCLYCSFFSSQVLTLAWEGGCLHGTMVTVRSPSSEHLRVWSLVMESITVWLSVWEGRIRSVAARICLNAASPSPVTVLRYSRKLVTYSNKTSQVTGNKHR